MVAGLGDPQAARVWLLQALTGRRASEILMLDFDPLSSIPGQERPTDSDDPDAFVAKLRYQQTKVDGVLPTILVEQAVVNVISEQQAWIRRRYPPDLSPKYLFLGLRHQHQGSGPRTYQSYGVTLNKLDNIHGLTDSAGRPLRFSQTHRLRHTRATELLNDGVPIHVVQRYLGHASPEMTLRYAATLAAKAESEFLRHKKDRRPRHRCRDQPPLRHLRYDPTRSAHRPDPAQRCVSAAAAEDLRQGQRMSVMWTFRHRHHPSRRTC